MKYRVRVDLFFESETDAQTLMASAKDSASRAVSLDEGTPNQQIAFCELEICRHDEGPPCTSLERVEVRNLPQ